MSVNSCNKVRMYVAIASNGLCKLVIVVVVMVTQWSETLFSGQAKINQTFNYDE